MKQCTGCKVVKPLDDYHKGGGNGNGYQTRCKVCRCQEEKTRRELDIVSFRKHSKNTTLQNFYGITLQQYQVMLGQQEGMCALCPRRTGASGRVLSVDHDHACCPGKKSCGKCVRRLLCSYCNSALGYASDDPELLRKMADYVESHR